MLTELQRAWSRRGYERTAVFEVVKGIVAAFTAYLLAVALLDSPVPAFAPFSALLVVQVTVYRSVLDSLRYIAAVVIGVIATGAIGLALGQTFWSLAALVTITLIVGQWRLLGQHGRQAAVAGLFAFVAADESGYLIALLLTVLSGAAVGVVISLLLAPPVRFDDASGAVRELGAGMREALLDGAAMLRSEEPLTNAGTLRDRFAELAALVDRARREVAFDAENRQLNPHRAGESRPATPIDHRTAIETFGRITGHLQSLARVLAYADRYGWDEMNGGLLGTFLPRYAALLEELAELAGSYGDQTATGRPDLAPLINSAQSRHANLADWLPAHRASDVRAVADCGALLVDAERAIAEFQFAAAHHN